MRMMLSKEMVAVLSGTSPSSPKAMNIPFTLSSLGYIRDKDNPNRFINPRGHPFYPIEFKDGMDKTQGDCIEAIARVGYYNGYQDAVADKNYYGIPVEPGVVSPLAGSPLNPK